MTRIDANSMMIILFVFSYDPNRLYRFEEKEDSSDNLQTWREHIEEIVIRQGGDLEKVNDENDGGEK